jgi:hypothetical protein
MIEVRDRDDKAICGKLLRQTLDMWFYSPPFLNQDNPRMLLVIVWLCHICIGPVAVDV